MEIIQTIQKNLSYGSLTKIDPNTQQVPEEKQEMGINALAQAGIPAILLGIFARLEQNPEWKLTESAEIRQLEQIFGSSTKAVIGKIQEYARIPDQHSVQELEHMADECMRVIRKNTSENRDGHTVQKFVASNKPGVIQYLPPELGLGILLNNNTLDDRTGKMNGPVSGLMHQMEKMFEA